MTQSRQQRLASRREWARVNQRKQCLDCSTLIWERSIRCVSCASAHKNRNEQGRWAPKSQ